MSLAVLSPAAAAPNQRDVAVRFGLTPEQSAGLYSQVDGMRGQMATLARSNGIKDATLRAIALELGARSPNLSKEQFVSLIEARAGAAARAQAKIAELDKAVAALDPGGERTQSQAVLQRARLAFDEGRLEDAEAAFGELSVLRSSEMAGARQAWLEALDLQAQSASLRGDTEKATDIRLAKMTALREQRQAAEREECKTALEIGADWLGRGERLGDNAALIKSIGYFRDLALPLAPRDKAPQDWAATQNALGVALRVLGERESSPARLEESVAAFHAALEENTRERAPRDWAKAQVNLGSALMRLGERDSGTGRLEEAAVAFRSALEVASREQEPLGWAVAQNNLGVVLLTLGERQGSAARLEEAAAAFRDALLERTRERVPLDWAMSLNNLGNVSLRLGQATGDTARLEQAATAFRAVLDVYTRERTPLDWAMAQHNLASATQALGEREAGTAKLEESVSAYRNALLEFTRERVPLQWASTQTSLGAALAAIGERQGDVAKLGEAVTAMRASLLVRTRESVPVDWAKTQIGIGFIRLLIARRGGSQEKPADIRRDIAEVRRLMAESGNAPVAALADYVLAQIDGGAKQ